MSGYKQKKKVQGFKGHLFSGYLLKHEVGTWQFRPFIGGFRDYGKSCKKNLFKFGNQKP
jgi:hypothetical protein